MIMLNHNFDAVSDMYSIAILMTTVKAKMHLVERKTLLMIPCIHSCTTNVSKQQGMRIST